LYGKPLDDYFENSMLLFNEIMVSVYLYVLLSLTDYNDDADLFENCGIALLSVVMLSFAVNFLKFVYFALRAIYRRLNRFCCMEPSSKSDATVAIKLSSQLQDENYQSDVTLDNFDMKNKKINRSPAVFKKTVKFNSKAQVTETQDFTSKSYYEEDELNVSKGNTMTPYRVSQKIKIPPPSKMQDYFPDDDIINDFEEQEVEEDVEEEKED
jgi:hypothetical protein